MYGAESDKCKMKNVFFLPVLEQQTLARMMKITKNLLQMSQSMLKKTKLTTVALYVFLCVLRLHCGVV